MNAWQVARQLAYLLRTATWPDTPSAVVFGEVAVTDVPLEQAIGAFGRFPLALIRMGGGPADPQQPQLLTESASVDLVVALPGDSVGERSLLGGPRAGGQGTSAGRGVLEVEEEAAEACQKLGGANGVRVRIVSRGRSAVSEDKAHGYVMSRGLALEVRCSAARHYPKPMNFVATGGVGQVVMTWDLPPARFDRLAVILRRASGATPPASATSGTGVTLASATATGVTDVVAAGTYSYALFESYDETSATPATADRYSESVTRASVVAT